MAHKFDAEVCVHPLEVRVELGVEGSLVPFVAGKKSQKWRYFEHLVFVELAQELKAEERIDEPLWIKLKPRCHRVGFFPRCLCFTFCLERMRLRCGVHLRIGRCRFCFGNFWVELGKKRGTVEERAVSEVVPACP